MDSKHLMPAGIGLQLYSTGEELHRDFEGTLRKIAEIGFSHVECFGQLQVTRTDLEKAGLACHSAHASLPELISNLQERLDFVAGLGARYLACSVPWVRDASKLKVDPNAGPFGPFFAAIEALTADDWKWSAENLNRAGEAAKKSGIQIAYHNHNFEFRRFGGEPAYDLLLRETDAELVKMELDCGWVVVAGFDPAAYLANHPGRFRLMHLRDFEAGFVPSTDIGFTTPELLGPAKPAVIGTGVLQYPEILAAARAAGVELYFVERDPFFRGAPMMELLRADVAGLEKLQNS